MGYFPISLSYLFCDEDYICGVMSVCSSCNYVGIIDGFLETLECAMPLKIAPGFCFVLIFCCHPMWQSYEVLNCELYELHLMASPGTKYSLIMNPREVRTFS
jgi:hypothetical protein